VTRVRGDVASAAGRGAARLCLAAMLAAATALAATPTVLAKGVHKAKKPKPPAGTAAPAGPGVGEASVDVPPPPGGSGARVAVFSLDGFDLPAAVESAPVRLTALLVAVVAKQGHGVITPALGLSDMSMALDCAALDEACYALIAGSLKAEGILMGEMRAEGGKTHVKVRLHSLGAAVRGGGIDETITLTPTNVAAELERLAALFERALAPPAPPPEPPRPPPASVPVLPPPDPGAGHGPASAGGGGGSGAVSVPGLVVAGVGAALLVAALPAGLNTSALNRRYADRVSSGEDATLDDLARLRDIETKGERSALATVILLAAGGAILTTGVVITAISLGRHGGAEPAAGGGAGPARLALDLSLGAMPLPGGAAAVARLRFGGRGLP
jgi:hypothetical protein